MAETGRSRARRAASLALALLVHSPAFAADLLEAVKTRNAPAVRALLAEGADADVRDVDGATPLLYAAHLGARELTRALLDAGADPELANRYGLAPLHEASRVADVELMTLLLEAGAEVDHALPEGETPLMLAARTTNPAAVRLLIEHGADVNVAERWQGQTALMYAAALDRGEVVAALLEAGADLHARTPLTDLPDRIPAARFNVEFPLGGMTALAFAARDGSLEAARRLVEAGAPLDEPTPEGFTPLVLALHNLHYDVAMLLVEAGASAESGALYAVVNARNRITFDGPERQPTGSTTELELLAAMLERGADLMDRPPQPLPDNQIGFGDVPMEPVDTALVRAARSADMESLRLLLDAGADPTLPEHDGLTPVIAVTEGPEIPPLVVLERERPDEPDAVNALELLLARGADINAADARGVAAIHTAARRGFLEVIRYLAANGADINAADEAGRTPLDYALGRYPAMFSAPPVHEEAAALVRELGGREGAGQRPPPRR